jgi:hypothetical protein
MNPKTTDEIKRSCFCFSLITLDETDEAKVKHIRNIVKKNQIAA